VFEGRGAERAGHARQAAKERAGGDRQSCGRKRVDWPWKVRRFDRQPRAHGQADRRQLEPRKETDLGDVDVEVDAEAFAPEQQVQSEKINPERVREGRHPDPGVEVNYRAEAH